MTPPLEVGRSFFKMVIICGNLAAPLLWRGAVSMLTEGRDTYSFLYFSFTLMCCPPRHFVTPPLIEWRSFLLVVYNCHSEHSEESINLLSLKCYSEQSEESLKQCKISRRHINRYFTALRSVQYDKLANHVIFGQALNNTSDTKPKV